MKGQVFNSLVFLTRLQRLSGMDAKTGIKRLKHWTIPNVCRSARVVQAQYGINLDQAGDLQQGCKLIAFVQVKVKTSLTVLTIHNNVTLILEIRVGYCNPSATLIIKGFKGPQKSL